MCEQFHTLDALWKRLCKVILSAIIFCQNIIIDIAANRITLFDIK